jgi:small subunit ribosomal protein S8
LSTVTVPSSKFRAKILDVLKGEGYISDYKFQSDEKNKGTLIVNLKYNKGLPVIRDITRVSKPGRRIYTKADSIPKIQSGLGIAIVSTSLGIMSDNDARTKKIGGEVICRVF